MHTWYRLGSKGSKSRPMAIVTVPNRLRVKVSNSISFTKQFIFSNRKLLKMLVTQCIHEVRI